jgi:hypothetical protein
MHKVAKVGTCIFDFVKFFRCSGLGFASEVEDVIQVVVLYIMVMVMMTRCLSFLAVIVDL